MGQSILVAGGHEGAYSPSQEDCSCAKMQDSGDKKLVGEV